MRVLLNGHNCFGCQLVCQAKFNQCFGVKLCGILLHLIYIYVYVHYIVYFKYILYITLAQSVKYFLLKAFSGVANRGHV